MLHRCLPAMMLPNQAPRPYAPSLSGCPPPSLGCQVVAEPLVPFACPARQAHPPRSVLLSCRWMPSSCPVLFEHRSALRFSALAANCSCQLGCGDQRNEIDLDAITHSALPSCAQVDVIESNYSQLEARIAAAQVMPAWPGCCTRAACLLGRLID